MKSLLLKQKREALLAEMDVLANKAELNDAEKARWLELKNQVAALQREISEAEEIENHLRERASKSSNEVSRGEERDIQKYSLVKAIREFLNGKQFTGIEAEMHTEAQSEMNNFAGQLSGIGISQKVLANKVVTRSTLAAASSSVVPTVLGTFLDAVWAKTVMVQLGAQTMSGLTGPVKLPYWSTKPSVKWDAENDAASDAAGVLDQISLDPHRITNYVPVSKLLLIQEAVGIEKRIWDALITATAIKLQHGAIQGGSDAPTGILATVGIGDVAGGSTGAAPTLAHMLALQREVALDDADFGALAYLASPQARWKLMSTALETGHPERVWNILQPEILLGYKAGVSTLMPDTLSKSSSGAVCSAIIFGNFNKLTIAQFGGIDMVVDPYTSAKSNTVELVINAFYDVAVEYPGAFAAMKDALCAS